MAGNAECFKAPRALWLVFLALTLAAGCTMQPAAESTQSGETENANLNDGDTTSSDPVENANLNDSGTGTPDIVEQQEEEEDPQDTSEPAVDTDGDGFSDFEEINGIPGTDPNDPDDNPDNVRDTDGDGCSDYDEINFLGFCDGIPDGRPVGEVPGGPPTIPGGSVSISGNLLAGATQIVDSDTGDPKNTFTSNDDVSADTAQPLPNPCTLGGFLGTSLHGQDVSDVFLVPMAAGQTATLLLASPTANDFDLFLFDSTGNALASSEGVDKAEQVTAPTNGTFLIQVFGFSVADSGDAGGLYTLLIGDTATAASVGPQLSSLHEFVEGEVIVKRVAGVTPAARISANGALGLQLMNDAATSGGFERLRISPGGAIARRHFAKQVGAGDHRPPISPTIAAIKELRRRPNILHAEPNYIRRATAVPNDEFFPVQWHYQQINLPQTWDITTGSPNVIVAVIDTGVVLDHPDLQGQLVSGFDFISDPTSALDGDGIDPDPNDPGDLALDGNRSTFHGTHVSGTIAARTNNATGVAGVAWDTRIMPLRALGFQGAGTDFDIAQAIRFAAGLTNDSGTVPAQRADIINMSLGGLGVSQLETDAVNAAREAGVTIVAAAGNESSNADLTTPAGIDGVVTVSATGLTRAIAPYSNFGTSVNVAAPGGNMIEDANGDTFPDGVLSTVGDDGGGLFKFFEGTSMASPHVAGVFALMLAVNPDLTPLDFDRLLSGEHPSTTLAITDDLGTAGRDDVFGHGLINALLAVRAAVEITGATAVDTPLMQISPRNLDFGSSAGSAEVTVSNAGVDTLSVTSVTVSKPWLSVAPTSGGAGPYTLTADRTDLVDGIYTAAVDFASNGGSASVSVRLQVGTLDVSGGDVGTVYVLLLSPTDFSTLSQDNTSAAAGYAYSFPSVPAGEYVLFAGTDMDNNAFIDNEGEAFGAYATLLDPVNIDATEDRSGLSFGVAYFINIQTPSSAGTNAAAPARTPRVRRIKTD